MRVTSSLLVVASLIATARSAFPIFPLKPSLRPLLAYAYPKPQHGLEDGFHRNLGTTIFIPGFHACGTLLVLSAEGLRFEDLEKLTGMSGIGQEWEEGRSSVVEDNALEAAVVSFARGWKNSCGRGEQMKEVRVAKVFSEGLAEAEGAERDAALEQLDHLIAASIKDLPAPPHPHAVVLTALSNQAITTLFSFASTSATNQNSNKQEDNKLKVDATLDGNTLKISAVYEERKQLNRSHLFRTLVWWIVIGAGIWYGGNRFKEWNQRRKEGRLRLPLDGGELDLSAE